MQCWFFPQGWILIWGDGSGSLQRMDCSIRPWGLPANLARCLVLLRLVVSATAKRVMEEFLQETSFHPNSLPGSKTTLTPEAIIAWGYGPDQQIFRVYCGVREWHEMFKGRILSSVKLTLTWPEKWKRKLPLDVLGWPKISFGFFHGWHGKTQRKFLANTIHVAQAPLHIFFFLLSRMACKRGPELSALNYSPQTKCGRCMLKYLYFKPKIF